MCASMVDIQSAAAEIRRGKKKEERTRMWANAQPDGRPAEHRWRPLFNAAKFGWRPLLDAAPNSEFPPSQGVQFRLPHYDFYIAHPGSNATALTPREPKKSVYELFYTACILYQTHINKKIKELLEARQIYNIQAKWWSFLGSDQSTRLLKTGLD